MKPIISVIFPVFNASQHLKEAIGSILSQNYQNFEIIIINDGSTDKSEEILKSYKDSRLKIITHRINKGLVYTLNEGFRHCRGKYIARMDADDIAQQNRFTTQASYLDNNPDIDVVGSSIRVFGIDNYFWTLPSNPMEVDAHSLFRCSLAHPSIMMRKTSVEQYKLTYSNLYPDAEDYFLWAKILAQGGKLANIKETLLRYRTHNTQIGYKNKKQINSTRRIYHWQLLNRLKINANIKELALHHGIATLTSAKNKRELLAKRDWLIKLISANRQYGSYDNKIFMNLCAEYWMDNCYVSELGVMKYLYMMLHPTNISIISKKLISRLV